MTRVVEDRAFYLVFNANGMNGTAFDFQSYLSTWSAKFGDVQNTLPTKQPFWDRPVVLDDSSRPLLVVAPSMLTAPSPGWRPRGQGPSKNNWTDHVPSGLPDKTLVFWGIFIFWY